jgi:hypothetical protein
LETRISSGCCDLQPGQCRGIVGKEINYIASFTPRECLNEFDNEPEIYDGSNKFERVNVETLCG